MSPIKNAQSAIYNAIKSIPYGDLLIALAPIFIGIEALKTLFYILGFGIPYFITCIFSIARYAYLLSLVAAFAIDKLYFIFGIFGLKALDYLIDIFKYAFSDYCTASLIISSIIGLLGYGALAYVFYYIYTKKQKEA